jgi:hypothetical protein
MLTNQLENWVMQNQTNELSKAVLLFLGFGSASSPSRDHARLIQQFGTIQGTAIASQVVALVDEVSQIQVDWSKHSFESAGNMVRSEMRACHPDLSDAALRALAWRFTFDWR